VDVRVLAATNKDLEKMTGKEIQRGFILPDQYCPD